MSEAWLLLLALVALGVPVQYAASLTPEEAAALVATMRHRNDHASTNLSAHK